MSNQVHWDADLQNLLLNWLNVQLWPEGDEAIEQALCMGVTHKREIVAVVAYHNWNQKAGVIELSAAASTPKWLTKTVLREMYAYPFEHINCQMVVKRVSEHNKSLLDQFERLGFNSYEIPRLRGRNENEIICTLTKEDWLSGKYSGENHG